MAPVRVGKNKKINHYSSPFPLLFGIEKKKMKHRKACKNEEKYDTQKT